MMVKTLARLPYAAETALSMLVRPHLEGDWPRPLAVVEHGRPGRFVAQAKTLIILDGDQVGLALAEPYKAEAVDSLYAYPMGKLKQPPQYEPLDAAASVRKWLRIALAAEAAGLACPGKRHPCSVRSASVYGRHGDDLGIPAAPVDLPAESLIVGIKRTGWPGPSGRGTLFRRRLRVQPLAAASGGSGIVPEATADLAPARYPLLPSLWSHLLSCLSQSPCLITSI